MDPGVMAEPLFQVQIPLYIFRGGSLIHIGEGSIVKSPCGMFYHGAFDFEMNSFVKLKEMEFDFPLYLVYGPNAERISIGDVSFSNRRRAQEFFGCFEIKVTPELNVAMDTPRSLTNLEY